MHDVQRDLTRVLLGVAFVGALIVAAFWIVRPFLAAAVWAAMIVVVTWSSLLRLQARLWNSRALATAVMTVLLLLIFVVPVTLAVGTIVANGGELAARARGIADWRMPPPPLWLSGLPFVGARLAGAWQEAAAAGIEGVWSRLAPYAGGVTAWFVAEAGTAGVLALQFVLTLALAAFMYAHGEAAAAATLRFGWRLGGTRGEALVRLAAQAVRGVALGVGLTAVIQSVLGGIGLAVAGVPFAGVLTAVLFMLCVTQIGMLVVLVPAVLWVYWSGHPGTGTFLLVWSLAASLLDNVLRPLFFRRSADLPMLLLFAGVIGGLIAYGLVGVFVGPAILAVAYTLLVAWLAQGPPPDEDAG